MNQKQIESQVLLDHKAWRKKVLKEDKEVYKNKIKAENSQKLKSFHKIHGIERSD